MNENLKLLVYIASVIVISFIAFNVSGKLFQKANTLHIKFCGSLVKLLIVILGATLILRNFPSYQKFYKTILTSSSLLVVVLGFAFQTSLSDIIAGLFISVFKPFEVNDRVTLKTQNITGIVESITLRHIVVRTFTNSRLVIPNHIANEEIIENNHIEDTRSANFLDVMVDYDCDLEKAKQILKEIIENHPDTINPNGDKKKDFTFVYTRELADNGIWLRANVWTKNVDVNFKVCSEIRDELLKRYKQENIKIPFPHTEIVWENIKENKEAEEKN